MAETNTNNQNQNNEGSNQNNQETNTQNQNQQNNQSQQVDTEAIKTDAINALLKTLGIENTETLQSIVTAHKEAEDKNKTELERTGDTLKETTRQLAEEQSKRLEAEAKLEALKQGANPDLVDDLVIIAKAKVTADKDIAKVISEMKEAGTVYFKAKEAGTNSGATVTRKRVNQNKESNQQKEKEPSTLEEKYAGTMAARLFARKNRKVGNK